MSIATLTTPTAVIDWPRLPGCETADLLAPEVAAWEWAKFLPEGGFVLMCPRPDGGWEELTLAVRPPEGFAGARPRRVNGRWEWVRAGDWTRR